MAGLYRWRVAHFYATEEEAMAFVKEAYQSSGLGLPGNAFT